MRRRMLVSLLLAVSPLSGFAQEPLQRAGVSGIAFEALRPNFKNDSDLSLLSAAYFLSYHRVMQSGTRLLLEVPFAHLSSSNDLIDESSTAFGNPYVGVQFRREQIRFDLGVRAPLASSDEEATFFGVMTDIERWEAFMPEVLSVRAGMAWESLPQRGVVYGIGLAPIFWISTGDENFNDDTELLLSYHAGVGYRGEQVRVTGRLGGRAVVTESDIDFSERTMHQLALSADFGTGSVRPGIYVALPLDEDLRDAISAIFGLTLQIRFGE